MGYNGRMKRKIIKTAIIGGGAAGLFLANRLGLRKGGICLFERGERLGRKLSATGNGQGNLTNVYAEKTAYFSATDQTDKKAALIRQYPPQSLISDMEKLGLLLTQEERGRVYPAGKQASSITDALRFSLPRLGVETRLFTQIVRLEKKDGLFALTAKNGDETEIYYAENVVLCTGGKAAKNFGTDGSAYALAQGFGHTVTPLYPSLVQLKTPTNAIKTWKGIRAGKVGVAAKWQENGEDKTHALVGDVIFTDYGVSGDAIFRISAFIADKIADGVTLSIDFLPEFSAKRLYKALVDKRQNLPDLPQEELLCGMVNNQIGRAIMRQANGDMQKAVSLLKKFELPVTGSLGFDYAQVTKGGVPLNETDERLQSVFVNGLYFAGEILDVDGECGGFNLQWAYSSACAVADAIATKTEKGAGHVCV